MGSPGVQCNTSTILVYELFVNSTIFVEKKNTYGSSPIRRLIKLQIAILQFVELTVISCVFFFGENCRID